MSNRKWRHVHFNQYFFMEIIEFDVELKCGAKKNMCTHEAQHIICRLEFTCRFRIGHWITWLLFFSILSAWKRRNTSITEKKGFKWVNGLRRHCIHILCHKMVSVTQPRSCSAHNIRCVNAMHARECTYISFLCVWLLLLLLAIIISHVVSQLTYV